MNLYLLLGFIASCLVVSILEVTEKKSLIFFDIILVIFYIALIANRSVYYTPDTLAYVEDFASVNTNRLYTPGEVTTMYRYEYGYTLISQIYKMIFGANVTLYFAVLGLFNLLITHLSVKAIFKYRYRIHNVSIMPDANEKLEIKEQTSKFLLFAPWFSIYVSYFGLMYSGIVLRQGIALTVLIITFSFFVRKRYFLGLLSASILPFFHNMAFLSIGVLIFLFTNLSFAKRTYAIYLILLLLLYLAQFYNIISSLIINFLFQKIGVGFLTISEAKMNTYLGYEVGMVKYSLGILFNLVFFMVVIYFSDIKDKFQEKLIQICLFALTLLILFAGIKALTRVVDYYFIFNIVLYYLVFFAKKVNLLRFAFFSIVVLVNAVVFFRLINAQIS
jgi:hypothetical protein